MLLFPETSAVVVPAPFAESVAANETGWERSLADGVGGHVRLRRARDRDQVLLRAAVGPGDEGVGVLARRLVRRLDRVGEANQGVVHERRRVGNAVQVQRSPLGTVSKSRLTLSG